MFKKIAIAIVIIAVILAAVAGGGYAAYNYLNQDLTGMSWEEIAAFKQEHPKVNVTYTINIEGGSAPIVLDQDASAVTLENAAQAADLVNKSGYVQSLVTIDASNVPLTAEEMDALRTAFPYAEEIRFTHIVILGESYALNTTSLDLSALPADQLDAFIAQLPHLKQLTDINLLSADGKALLSVDDVLKLHAAVPEVHLNYAFNLFGLRVTTDAQTLEYARTHIGDEGLQTIRKVLPLLPNLTYLKLDDCGTSDEAMAQLRADYPNIEVHWRIFYSVFDCMTDNYKLWTIGGLMDKQIGPFDHLRGIKYLDLGHNYFTHLDFMKNLKDVEVAILAIGQLEDISGIAGCTKLEFLEIFSNRKLDNEDMKHLSGLVNLEYLNISNIPNMTDLSFTDNMTKLKKLWCTLSKVPQEEIDRVKALHPDCEFVFLPDGDPTNYGWRYNPDGSETARYALLREQIGYAKDDVSQYPKGELKHEITYESTGITPDD